MVWGVSHKVGKKSDSQSSSAHPSNGGGFSGMVSNTENMNISAASTFEAAEYQDSTSDDPPAYSPGATDLAEAKTDHDEEESPFPQETTAQKIEKLLREKAQMLENEDEEKYAVDEAWLERFEAWNRLQESGMTTGEEDYHQTAVAWEKLRNIRERTRLRVRRTELDIKAMQKKSRETES